MSDALVVGWREYLHPGGYFELTVEGRTLNLDDFTEVGVANVEVSASTDPSDAEGVTLAFEMSVVGEDEPRYDSVWFTPEAATAYAVELRAVVTGGVAVAEPPVAWSCD